MNKPVPLKKKSVLEFTPKTPFCFDATMHKPDHFPSGDNEWQPGVRWQTMLWKGEALGLKLENRGTAARPGFTVSIWSKGELSENYLDSLTAEIDYRYHLQADLSSFNRRFNTGALVPIIRKWNGMRPISYGSLYEYLIIAIVLQNATLRRSVNMMQTLFEQYGTLLSYDGKELFCFWSPETIEDVTEQDLRGLKIGYRAKSIKRVTGAFVKGEINEDGLRAKTLNEQRQAILKLYGIGPASVGYILFDVFHQWDELAYISPWEQKIYSRLFLGKDTDYPASMQELLDFFSSHFGGYRMLAVHYFWEDLFWKRKNRKILWLEELIRL